MSTLSTTVRRGLVVTAAAVAAGPVVGGIASAAVGPTTSSPLAHGLPLVGNLTHGLPVAGLTQGLPLGDGLGSLSNLNNLGNLSTVPVAGPALGGLTSNIMPMNGMLAGVTGTPATTPAAAASAPAAAAAPAAVPATAPATTPAVAHPATRSRKAVGSPHTAAASPLASSAAAGPKLLSGMPMVDTPLGEDAPSLSELPQYAGVKKMGLSDMAPVVAAAQAAAADAPQSTELPVIGKLPPGGLGKALPLGALSSVGSLTSIGGLTGLLGHF